MIVVVATLAASLVQTPLATFLRYLEDRLLGVPDALEQTSSHVIEKDSRVEQHPCTCKPDLLGLESAVESEKDAFLKKLQNYLVDGNEPDAIHSSMEIQIGRHGQLVDTQG